MKIRLNFLHCFYTLLIYIALVSSCSDDPKYTGPQEERDAFWLMDKYAQSLGQSHSIELIDVGCFFPEIATKKPFLFGLWLKNSSALTLEEGRKLSVALVQDFSKTLKESPVAQRYIDHMHEYSSRKYPFKTMDMQYVGIKLAFWDKNSNRPPIPYLAQVAFYDGKFHYYQADPVTQALILILEETFDEAVEKLKTK